jgi:hypothetical protein
MVRWISTDRSSIDGALFPLLPVDPPASPCAAPEMISLIALGLKMLDFIMRVHGATRLWRSCARVTRCARILGIHRDTVRTYLGPDYRAPRKPPHIPRERARAIQTLRAAGVGPTRRRITRLLEVQRSPAVGNSPLSA